MLDLIDLYCILFVGTYCNITGFLQLLCDLYWVYIRGHFTHAHSDQTTSPYHAESTSLIHKQQEKCVQRRNFITVLANSESSSATVRNWSPHEESIHSVLYIIYNKAQGDTPRTTSASVESQLTTARSHCSLERDFTHVRPMPPLQLLRSRGHRTPPTSY